MKVRFSFFLLLCVGFLDFMGIGLVFPMFASMLFDPQIPLLAPDTSEGVRGMWMGFLISLAPLTQFFGSPILGIISDQRGRKNVILLGLMCGLLGYLLAILGVYMYKLWLLFLYRLLFGISASTMTVVQAAIADMSRVEEKPRRFALYNMALGFGFTIGPFLGGKLSDPSFFSWFNMSTPFVFGAIVTALNISFLHWKFRETRLVEKAARIDLFKGFRDVKKAIFHPILSVTFVSLFAFHFGWDYFFEFIPVYLKRFFDYTRGEVGTYYAYMGFMYALSTGLLIRPFVKRFKASRLLMFSMLTSSLYTFLGSFINHPFYFWFYIPLLNFFLALFFPVASTFISDQATDDSQGEVFGIYHSVESLALVLSPLLSGFILGKFPIMVIYLGSGLMFFGGALFTISYLRKKQRVGGASLQ